MSGPTNQQKIIGPISADTEKLIRSACEAQGCTCGDRLKVIKTAMSLDEIPEEDREWAQENNVEQAHRVEVQHLEMCPMLHAMSVN